MSDFVQTSGAPDVARVRTPEPTVTADPKWRNRAACRDSDDPDLWFPIGDTEIARAQTDEAIAVCRRCAAIASCLAWALESGQDFGVAGGMSEAERKALKRRAMRNAGKTAAA